MAFQTSQCKISKITKNSLLMLKCHLAGYFRQEMPTGLAGPRAESGRAWLRFLGQLAWAEIEGKISTILYMKFSRYEYIMPIWPGRWLEDLAPLGRKFWPTDL